MADVWQVVIYINFVGVQELGAIVRCVLANTDLIGVLYDVVC